MTIHEFQLTIKNIYNNVNLQNGHNHDYFFSYLTRTISSGFKKIRYMTDPSEKFAKSITYIFGLCELTDTDLQESFLKRFPKICPYCLTSPCKCYLTNKQSALNIPQRKYQDEMYWQANNFLNEIKGKNLCIDFDYLADMLHQIYPLNAIYWKMFRGPEFHINKCLEELGEIQEAYSIYLSKPDDVRAEYLLQVQDEICDLFAWILSAWRLQCKDLNITNFLVRMYRNICPSCNQSVCICKSRNNSSDMLWRKEEIENIYILLQKLNIESEDLSILLELFKNSIASNSSSQYKICIKKTIEFLSSLSNDKANKQVDDLNKTLELFKTKL